MATPKIYWIDDCAEFAIGIIRGTAPLFRLKLAQRSGVPVDLTGCSFWYERLMTVDSDTTLERTAMAVDIDAATIELRLSATDTGNATIYPDLAHYRIPWTDALGFPHVLAAGPVKMKRV